MPSFLTVVLTSSDIKKCKQALSSIEGDDVIVICNSMDEGYYNELQQSGINVPIIQTESNGTPGKGKQSVVDYFLTTEYDYLIQIDGDDIFYPNGHQLLIELLEKNTPDVFGLLNEDILVDGHLPWKWNKLKKFTNLFLFKNNSSPDYIEKVNTFFSTMEEMVGHPFVRILGINRKAAETCQYDTNMTGAEDIKQYCMYKLNSDIDVQIFDCQDIYLYCRSTDSRSASDRLYKNSLANNLKILNESFSDEEKSILKTTNLSITNIDPKIKKQKDRLNTAINTLLS